MPSRSKLKANVSILHPSNKKKSFLLDLNSISKKVERIKMYEITKNCGLKIRTRKSLENNKSWTTLQE